MRRVENRGGSGAAIGATYSAVIPGWTDLSATAQRATAEGPDPESRDSPLRGAPNDGKGEENQNAHPATGRMVETARLFTWRRAERARPLDRTGGPDRRRREGRLSQRDGSPGKRRAEADHQAARRGQRRPGAHRAADLVPDQ